MPHGAGSCESSPAAEKMGWVGRPSSCRLPVCSIASNRAATTDKGGEEGFNTTGEKRHTQKKKELITIVKNKEPLLLGTMRGFSSVACMLLQMQPRAGPRLALQARRTTRGTSARRALRAHGAALQRTHGCLLEPDNMQRGELVEGDGSAQRRGWAAVATCASAVWADAAFAYEPAVGKEVIY